MIDKKHTKHGKDERHQRERDGGNLHQRGGRERKSIYLSPEGRRKIQSEWETEYTRKKAKKREQGMNVSNERS